MLRSPLVAIAAAIACIGCRPAIGSVRPQAAAELHLSLDFIDDPGDTTAPVMMRLELPPRPDSIWTLRLPSEYAGRTELYRNVRGLTTTTPGATVQPTERPDRFVLRVPTSRPAVVTWRLRSTAPSSSKPDAHNYSDIGPRWGQLVGHDALLLPDLPNDTRVSATLRFFEMPAGAAIATSFGSPTSAGSPVRADVPLGDLRRALFTFAREPAAVRAHHSVVGDGNLTILMRGHHAIPDSTLVDAVQRVMTAERSFWRAPAAPNYLVSIGVAPRGSLGGQRLANAFIADIDSLQAMDAGVLELFAHEFMHEWIGSGRLRPASTLRDGELAWFGEGFDDFESHRVARAAGILSDSAYVTHVNKALVDHAISSVRDSSWRVIVDTRNSAGQREPYLRGELLALRLNAAIEQETHGTQSLDSTLKKMFARTPAGDPGFTPDRLYRELGETLGAARVRIETERVLEGGPIILPDNALGRCATATMGSHPRWDPGFEVDASLAAKRTVGVRAGGPAQRAGMHDGMAITSASIWRGDATKYLELGVRTDTGAFKVRYLPAGEVVAVQQWTLRPGCVP